MIYLRQSLTKGPMSRPRMECPTTTAVSLRPSLTASRQSQRYRSTIQYVDQRSQRDFVLFYNSSVATSTASQSSNAFGLGYTRDNVSNNQAPRKLVVWTIESQDFCAKIRLKKKKLNVRLRRHCNKLSVFVVISAVNLR